MNSSGKACFLCKDEAKERELVNYRQCPSCSPTVILPKAPQKVLEHMAAHILFDSKTNASMQPCGLCLRPSPTCVFYLKKGKGTDANPQVDPKTSRCSNFMSFSYGIAKVSTPASPCSNVSIRCQWCNDDNAPAIWHHNLRFHVKEKHSWVSLKDNEDAWKIGNAEKESLKKLWEVRHKQKPLRKSKKLAATPLVISQAHSSHLVLRFVVAKTC